MADRQAATDAILEALVKNAEYSANNVGSTWSKAVLELAEAYAWVTNPAQPHGGSPAPAK